MQSRYCVAMSPITSYADKVGSGDIRDRSGGVHESDLRNSYSHLLIPCYEEVSTHLSKPSFFGRPRGPSGYVCSVAVYECLDAVSAIATNSRCL